jgi:hypothetical protein
VAQVPQEDRPAGAWTLAGPPDHQVERWFGFLADQMIHRDTHKSVQALEADVTAWVASWNEDPKPFIWTKTAEQIRESLARLCQRISDAGH